MLTIEKGSHLAILRELIGCMGAWKAIWQLLWAGRPDLSGVGELVTVALLVSALTSPTRPVPACTPIRHQIREHLSEATAIVGDSLVPQQCHHPTVWLVPASTHL